MRKVTESSEPLRTVGIPPPQGKFRGGDVVVVPSGALGVVIRPVYCRADRSPRAAVGPRARGERLMYAVGHGIKLYYREHELRKPYDGEPVSTWQAFSRATGIAP